MSLRRVTASLVSVMLVGAACVGGGGGDGDGEAETSDGKTVVRLFEGFEETPQLEAQRKEVIAEFEEQNPEIDVEREAITPEDQRTVIQTRLRSDSPPDLFGYDTGAGFAGVLAEAGLLYDLTDAYEQYDWPVFDWAKQRVTYDGVLSGVPGSVEEIGVFYNADVFNELGFEEPATLEEFEQIAEAVKAEGMIPLAFGDNEQWPAGHLFSMSASNILGPEGLDERLYGDASWDSPEVVKAIDLMFRDFVDKGYFPEDVNAITYEDANGLFYSGEAAMVPTGTWLVPEIDETVDFEVGFFPFPSVDGSGVSPPSGVGGGLFVAGNTEEPEATIKLLDYLAFDEERVQEDVERFNTIPAFEIDTSEFDVTPLFRSVLDDLSESEDPSAFGYNIDVLAPQGFNTVMFEGFQEVINGSRTPEEQAQALQEAWAEAEEAGETLEKP